MFRISCDCGFDITRTDITGYYRPDRIPFVDRAGNKITDQSSWVRSRNKQRNLETVTQIISLRTQVFDLSDPVKKQDQWHFEFSVDSLSVYTNQDTFDILKQDAHNVPMLIIDETNEYRVVVIDSISPNGNLSFKHLTINTSNI